MSLPDPGSACGPRPSIPGHRLAHSHDRIELTGHLLDSGLITRLFDLTDEAGGEASVEQLLVAQRHDQPSTAQRMRMALLPPNDWT